MWWNTRWAEAYMCEGWGIGGMDGGGNQRRGVCSKQLCSVTNARDKRIQCWKSHCCPTTANRLE